MKKINGRTPRFVGLGIILILLSVFIQASREETVYANNPTLNVRANAPIIDEPIDLITDTKWNYFGDVAYNSNHEEYLVVWITEQDSSSRDIWARRVGRDGAVLSIFNVDNSAGDILERPYVVYNPVEDEYFIIYTNWYDSSGDADIFARRVSWDGGWMSGVITIIDTVDEQLTFSLAYNSRDNEYLVAYVNQWAGGLIDIYAQRHAPDGSLLSWSAVASSSEAERTYPNVVYNPAANNGTGGYLFSYYYYHTTNYTSKLLFKTSELDLSDVWANSETPICDSCYANMESQAATDGTDYLLAWWDSGGSNYQVKGRRVNSEGVLQGDANGFGISDGVVSPPIYMDLDLDYSLLFGYLTLWQFETASTHEVYGNFTPAGADSTPNTPFGITDPAISTGRWAAACSPWDCLVAYEWWNVDNFDLSARFLRGNQIFIPSVFK